jgi:hypothetical protein
MALTIKNRIGQGLVEVGRNAALLRKLGEGKPGEEDDEEIIKRLLRSLELTHGPGTNSLGRRPR